MMKPKYSPKVHTIMAIIMGHSVDELSKDAGQRLLDAAGLSLKNASKISAVYILLLNIRGTKDFEDMIMHSVGENKNRKRIDYSNEILHDTYLSYKKYWDKILNYKDQNQIPNEFVLGYRGR